MTSKPPVLANVVHKTSVGSSDAVSLTDHVHRLFDPSVTWKDLEWMVGEWDGPLIIKGILHPADARQAHAIGAKAVIISNHGGRQLDGASSSLDALPRIADAVGNDIELLLDGGIRRGTHVLKAMALGATACLIGPRLSLWPQRRWRGRDRPRAVGAARRDQPRHGADGGVQHRRGDTGQGGGADVKAYRFGLILFAMAFAAAPEAAADGYQVVQTVRLGGCLCTAEVLEDARLTKTMRNVLAGVGVMSAKDEALFRAIR